MGKREIGELSILDLVVFIMLGDIAVISIEKFDRPLLQILIPMAILLFIQLALSILSLKSLKFRKLLDGSPSIIINNGKIDETVMRKQRYNFNDLITQLREKGVLDLHEVQFAILETTGKLSVIKKEESNRDNETPYPLVLDGEIQSESLMKINKNVDWLMEELKKKGYEHVEEISICSYVNGNFYIDRKEAP